MKPRTGAERYLRGRMSDPEYAAAYRQARERIDPVDILVRAMDARRIELDLSKAELGRRAGIAPEVVRRLLTVESPNPTLSTFVALADALNLAVAVTPATQPAKRAPKRARSVDA